jgi:hypothetical protein
MWSKQFVPEKSVCLNISVILFGLGGQEKNDCLLIPLTAVIKAIILFEKCIVYIQFRPSQATGGQYPKKRHPQRGRGGT